MDNRNHLNQEQQQKSMNAVKILVPNNTLEQKEGLTESEETEELYKDKLKNTKLWKVIHGNLSVNIKVRQYTIQC